MDHNDRAAIDDLFRKLAEVERRSGPRDRAAEEYIQSLTRALPAAPYYMAQTIVVQEQALEAAQRRIEELEAGAAQPARGGFLDGLFGGGRGQSAYARREPGGFGYRPWGAPGAGGGFLAGAAQTAMGVAGGVLLGNMLADWLTPDQAVAQDVAADQDAFSGAEGAADVQVADAGDFGDFDVGDF
jgi:hypothetical protein